MAETGEGRTGSRLAWCYEDPGVAAALSSAARRVGRDDWSQEARKIAVDGTLDFRHEDHGGVPGFGDYPYYGPNPENMEQLVWREDVGFLTGATGVGLGLLAAITEIEPAWDRLLAISLPPTRG